MRRITFGPGPSRLSDVTKADILNALETGVPEISHRSAAFTQTSRAAVSELRAFFGIPTDYGVLYTASATDAMELLVRNCVERKSFHFTCGSFSELFARVAQAHGKETTRNAVPWGKMNDVGAAQIPADTELVSLTYNETSTGVMAMDTDVATARTLCPHALLCVDVTSIAGMKCLQIADADTWFFSVQKGFGLPAGLGVLIVSPRVLARARELRRRGTDRAGLFAFGDMADLMDKSAQTLNTPNVLGIHLLQRQLERWNSSGGAAIREEQARSRSGALYRMLEKGPWTPFVRDPLRRSLSVVCLQGEPQDIARLHERAAERGLELGRGYGALRETTARIAVFPGLTDAHLYTLFAMLREEGMGT